MVARIDIKESRELQDVALALRDADKELSKQFRVHTKKVAQVEWIKALRQSASTQLEQRVIADTAVVSISNQNVRVQSAGKGRPLRGGLAPKHDYAPVEYGAKPNKKTYTRRSPKGTPHRVTRNTHAQFKPPSSGYVFQPTASRMIPRLVALWAQTAVRTLAEAIEGK